MGLPLISIITVVYNGAKTIEKSIKSIIEQSYQNVDYVIIDGGSSDGTTGIIKKYENKIGFWISEADQGIYDAMNKGIRVAKGEWLYFLGSDDVLYDKTVLGKAADQLQTCDCDFFYGNVIMASQKKVYDGPFDFDKLLKRNISHQAIFFKNYLFKKIGMYNTRYKICADWDFNIRCFQQNDFKPVYADITIAHFAKGGASSHYDILFLRELIIPLRIERLLYEPNKLKKIMEYDECWRLLRNSQIHSLKELYYFAKNEKIPVAIKNMVLWQKRIPFRILKIGLISKCCMGLHYIVNFKRINS